MRDAAGPSTAKIPDHVLREMVCCAFAASQVREMERYTLPKSRLREMELCAFAASQVSEMERYTLPKSQLREMELYASAGSLFAPGSGTRLLSPCSSGATLVSLWVEAIHAVREVENPNQPRQEERLSTAEERKAAVRDYKRECREAGKHVTNADICKAAGYGDEKILYRWQARKIDCPKIEAVLRNKPHLKKSQKSQ
jgi:hypothetical protein